MPKTRISEYSTTNTDNSDIESINISEGCAPSGINNAIRELMVHLKEFQTGASGDAFTFAGGVLISGSLNTATGAMIMSGANVIAHAAGTVSAPSIYANGDTNTGIFFPAADTIAFAEGGAEAMRIDSSGNVGIGTTSPGNKITIQQAANNIANGILLSNAAATQNGGWYHGGSSLVGREGGIDTIHLAAGNVGIGTSSPKLNGNSGTFLSVVGTNANGWLDLGTTSQSNDFGGAIAFNNTNIAGSDKRVAQIFSGRSGADNSAYLAFLTWNAGTGAERVRITSAGGFEAKQYVKTDTYFWSAGAGSDGGLYLGATGSANGQISQASTGAASTATYIGNQQITTSSDVRLKENIVDSQRNAVEILNKLRVVDFTWNDPSDQCVNNKASRGVWTGLIAQEAINHVPWLVNKPLEDEESDGTKNYWLMDYGHTVPLLVKAIQELKAELDTVKTQNAAFEARLAALEAK